MNLSILIPTVPPRAEQLQRLLSQLEKQIAQNQLERKVEVVVLEDDFEHTIGSKRNSLLDSSQGKFVVFVDDDDELHEDYCKIVSEVIDNKDVDYIGYRVARFFGGRQQLYEYRSIYFDHCYQDKHGSYRHISHTNPILASVAKMFTFPEVNSGEDAEWCQQIFESQLLKTEHYIGYSMYIQHYDPKTSLSVLQH